jgi:hypothetical protein
MACRESENPRERGNVLSIMSLEQRADTLD